MYYLALYIFNSYQILRSNLILVLQKDDITYFVAFHVLTKEKQQLNHLVTMESGIWKTLIKSILAKKLRLILSEFLQMNQ